MEYLYVRASTNEDKQNLLRQLRFGTQHNILDCNVFKEYASGANTQRKELNRLLSIVKEGDTIYASDVSRLTRSLKHLMSLIDFAKEKKLKLVFGDFEIDCRNTISVLVQGQLLMLGLVNELMRLLLVESVNDGLAAAREQGRVGGQPRLTKERIYAKNPDFVKYYIDYKNNKINLKELSRLSCVSRNTASFYCKIIEES